MVCAKAEGARAPKRIVSWRRFILEDLSQVRVLLMLDLRTKWYEIVDGLT
jgi:hypothetical protein